MRIKIEHPMFSALRAYELDALVRKVADLHEPEAVQVSDGYVVRWECKGCDPGEYAESKADAPCATLRLITDAYGVEVPS